MVDQQDTHAASNTPGLSPKTVVLSKRDSTKSGPAALHVLGSFPNPVKLSGPPYREDVAHPPDTLQESCQMLRVIDAQTYINGSRRPRSIGSGVHHFDGDFFAGQQVADVPDESLSVDRDNVERHGLRLHRVRP